MSFNPIRLCQKQAFAGCVHGIDHIGFVALAQAIGFITITIIFTIYAQCFSRHQKLNVLGAILINAMLALTWLLWRPEVDTLWIVLLLAGVHGVVHAVYKIQAGSKY